MSIMLVHPLVAGHRTMKGAALTIVRCRAKLAAQVLTDDETDMFILARDGLLDKFGEPPKEAVVAALIFLGNEWKVCRSCYLKSTDEWERAEEIRYTAQIEACRRLYREATKEMRKGPTNV